MLTALGAILLLGLGLAVLVGLLAVRPLRRIREASEQIVAGRLDTRLNWRRRDDIGRVARALDALAASLEAAQARLEGLTLQDALTGLINHRAVQDRLHEEIERAEREGGRLALVVLDIDHFEHVNDAWGHATGDEALRVAARVIRELRPGDLCGRIGGDEFLLVLPAIDAWEAARVVEQLRSAVRAVPIGGAGVRVTFSAGIAEFPRDAADQIGLMRLAEGALYRAKRSGRNRCIVYSALVDAPLSLQEEAERARTAGLLNTVYALARAVDLKDGYTHQHSTRVAHYAAELAAEFGMGEDEIEQIRTAGILHDVGKIGVSDAILLKPARLTDEEFEEMQRHSTLGRDIVAGAGMPEIADWVLYLHERYDGKGYPERLAGERIPFASRILSVADAFEAMTSSRLYRRGMPVEQALAELERAAGKEFDPAIARRMVELVREGVLGVEEIGVLDVARYGAAASGAEFSAQELPVEPPPAAPARDRPRSGAAHR
jgi:diguanylate cyclase (GGDEF)-like protein